MFGSAGEGRRRSVGPIVWEKKKCYRVKDREENVSNNKNKDGKLDWSHLA
jgi:hypothetical protein